MLTSSAANRAYTAPPPSAATHSLSLLSRHSCFSAYNPLPPPRLVVICQSCDTVPPSRLPAVLEVQRSKQCSRRYTAPPLTPLSRPNSPSCLSACARLFTDGSGQMT
jgi:hypothetical protein